MQKLKLSHLSFMTLEVKYLNNKTDNPDSIISFISITLDNSSDIQMETQLLLWNN